MYQSLKKRQLPQKLRILPSCSFYLFCFGIFAVFLVGNIPLTMECSSKCQLYKIFIFLLFYLCFYCKNIKKVCSNFSFLKSYFVKFCLIFCFLKKQLLFKNLSDIITLFGADDAGATPVPISNTEVKTSSAEDTQLAMTGENMQVPIFLYVTLLRCTRSVK